MELGWRSLAARVTLAIGAAVLVAALAGEARASPPPRASAARTWTNNATVLIEQLDQDVLTSATAGADIATARTVLNSQSDQIAVLIADDDFGSCHESVRNLGVPATRLQPVANELASACTILEQASTLLTRATSRSDPRPLVASARLSRRAGLLLLTATSELETILPLSSG